MRVSFLRGATVVPHRLVPAAGGADATEAEAAVLAAGALALAAPGKTPTGAGEAFVNCNDGGMAADDLVAIPSAKLMRKQNINERI